MRVRHESGFIAVSVLHTALVHFEFILPLSPVEIFGDTTDFVLTPARLDSELRFQLVSARFSAGFFNHHTFVLHHRPDRLSPAGLQFIVTIHGGSHDKVAAL